MYCHGSAHSRSIHSRPTSVTGTSVVTVPCDCTSKSGEGRGFMPIRTASPVPALSCCCASPFHRGRVWRVARAPRQRVGGCRRRARIGGTRLARGRGLAARRPPGGSSRERGCRCEDRKSTRLNSSHQLISYAVFCLKKKKTGR